MIPRAPLKRRLTVTEYLLLNAKYILTHVMVAALVWCGTMAYYRRGAESQARDLAAAARLRVEYVDTRVDPRARKVVAAAPSGADVQGAAAAAAAAADGSVSSLTCPSPAAGSPCPAPPAAASKQSSRRHPNPWITEQLCHVLPDDSEFCEYDGPICYAGSSQVVIASTEPAIHLGRHDDGYAGGCCDYRWWEVNDRCGYSFIGGGRSWKPKWAPGESAIFAAQNEVYPSSPIDGTGRLWGPMQRFLHVGHVHPSSIIDATQDWGVLGPEWKGAAAAAREMPVWQEPAKHSMAIKPPKSVTWLDGNTYIVYMSHDAYPHPWHFAIATFQMWAIRRLNSTTRAADTGASLPFRYTLGAHSEGAFKPIDNLVMPSLYSKTAHIDMLPSWTRTSFRMIVQNHTQLILPLQLNSTHFADEEHWLCSKSGTLIGEKSRVFTGAGDAHAWRAAAYAAAGVSSPAWAAHPPRSVTILIRERFRHFLNMDAVTEIVRSTGLRVRIVDWVAKWSWQEQVELFATTGILITAHGAALANLMYMPVHSVAIEVFPPLGVVPIYRRLAETCRVTYYPIYTSIPGNETLERMKDVEEALDVWSHPDFVKSCLLTPHSSTDAMLEPKCDKTAKRSQLEVPLDTFRLIFGMAMDDIGCKDNVCREGEFAFRNYSNVTRLPEVEFFAKRE